MWTNLLSCWIHATTRKVGLPGSEQTVARSIPRYLDAKSMAEHPRTGWLEG